MPLRKGLGGNVGSCFFAVVRMKGLLLRFTQWLKRRIELVVNGYSGFERFPCVINFENISGRPSRFIGIFSAAAEAIMVAKNRPMLRSR